MFRPGNQDTKLYETLGISKSATDSEIKKAYRKLAMKYHPDKQKSKSQEEQTKAEERFKEISAAYGILGDEKKRKSYDQFGMDGIGPGGETGPSFNMGGMGGMGGMPDIFQNFFGGNQGAQQSRVKVGSSRMANVNVTLEEIYSEAGKIIEITRYVRCEDCNGIGGKNQTTCSICDGKGSILKINQLAPGFVQQSQQICHKCSGQGKIIKPEDQCKTCVGTARIRAQKKLKINLTRKTRSQEKIVLQGYSDYNPNVDKQGDFIFIIKIKPHSKYTISGCDLRCSETISLEEALCGFERELLLPNNVSKKYKITSVIHPNDIYSIVGEGLNDSNGTAGDIKIEFNVVFPNQIDKERKIYIQKLLKRYTPKKQRVNPTLDEVTPIKIEFENKKSETLYEEDASFFEDDPLFEDLKGGPQCAQQ